MAAQGLSEGNSNSRRPSRATSEKNASSDILEIRTDHENGINDKNSSFQLPSPLPSPIEPLVPQPGESAPPYTPANSTDTGKTRKISGSIMAANDDKPLASPTATKTHAPGVRRLSASKMAELAGSLPIAALPDKNDTTARSGFSPPSPVGGGSQSAQLPRADFIAARDGDIDEPSPVPLLDGAPRMQKHWNSTGSLRTLSTPPVGRRKISQPGPGQPLPVSVPGSVSTAPAAQPVLSNTNTRRLSQNAAVRPPPLHIDSGKAAAAAAAVRPQLTQKPETPNHGDQHQQLPLSLPPQPLRLPSPIPPSIPLPPMSLPTVLQLELAGQRPSPLYIHHSHASDLPYESNAVKFERLKNFLLLPTYLERTMYFGALACLDAWLWTLTILPIRFFIALGVLVRWWAYVAWKEVRWMTAYVWRGLGRMWRRGRRPSVTVAAADRTERTGPAAGAPITNGRPRGRSNGSSTSDSGTPSGFSEKQPHRQPSRSRNRRSAQTPHEQTAAASSAASRPTHKLWGHRRTKSMPSNLTSFHKADLLQGAVIICSSLALMNLDASRMYHFIRAQSAVKLYVIYNLVEVGDRLLSALGQDVFECLFSAETLSRTASGRSKLLLPFGMFCLSLVYNIAHTVVLFYQVITLNVAVNSYSNALLSLLMSNQFVEVKSSVFKRTEKENTFQLACADIVERFQLWIVLFIIALRNVVEIGGLSVPGAGIDLGGGSGAEDIAAGKIPLHNTSILPASFTILPSWLVSVEVLSPFLIVIGSEMVVDWIKHGYINKFNNIKPNFYSRVLDILCKDYYTNAFVTPALMRRLGLPLVPLCTLFLRSSVQTYHMFLATHLPSPSPPSTHTSLVVDPSSASATPSSPAMAASLERLDLLIRNALGRSVHGNPYSTFDNASSAMSSPASSWSWWSSDDIIAGATMVVVFFIMFLILLIAKLLLGMALLRYARNRYAAMKVQEHAEALGKAEPESFDATGKRTGGYGKVEVGEDRRRWIFQDDPEGLKKLRDRERKGGVGGTGGKKEMDLSKITRYEMVAKRIW